MIRPVGQSILNVTKAPESSASTSAPRSTGDTIQSKENTSYAQKMGAAVKSAFSWIYIQMRLLISKVFFCFDSLKLSETLVEKYQGIVKELDAKHHAFKERAKRSDIKELRTWWRLTFENFPREVRRMLILEDVKTYAGDHADIAAFAEKNYAKYHSLAQQFVRELETINGNDPLDYIPGYLQNIIDHYQAKIKDLGDVD
ncbi:MAG: hypothetical protein P0S96_03520 [Simkaniaceae bacterium]|nr:hypothetical protein [Candidatus Sacchlamyda saccharinae]